DLEVGIDCITFVPQEQRLLAVGYEHPDVVRELDFGHVSPPLAGLRAVRRSGWSFIPTPARLGCSPTGCSNRHAGYCAAEPAVGAAAGLCSRLRTLCSRCAFAHPPAALWCPPL